MTRCHESGAADSRMAVVRSRAASLPGLAILLILLPGRRPEVARWIALALPVILAAALVLAIRIARKGESSTPIGLALLGFAFVAGGALFDVVATLSRSPDLRLEANPIARLFLDSGESLTFVFIYAAVCQTMLVLTICALWNGVLKHRSFLIESVRGCHSPLLLLKATTGGRFLTWQQWLIPFRRPVPPDARFVVCMLGPALVAGSAYRWYLGLEWLGFVNYGYRVYVLVGSMSDNLTRRRRPDHPTRVPPRSTWPVNRRCQGRPELLPAALKAARYNSIVAPAPPPPRCDGPRFPGPAPPPLAA